MAGEDYGSPLRQKACNSSLTWFPSRIVDSCWNPVSLPNSTATRRNRNWILKPSFLITSLPFQEITTLCTFLSLSGEQACYQEEGCILHFLTASLGRMGLARGAQAQDSKWPLSLSISMYSRKWRSWRPSLTEAEIRNLPVNKIQHSQQVDPQVTL